MLNHDNFQDNEKILEHSGKTITAATNVILCLFKIDLIHYRPNLLPDYYDFIWYISIHFIDFYQLN